MPTPITVNFTLEELTTTSRPENNDPSHAQLRNLYALAFAAQCIRDVIGPMKVTSGFRSPAVNMAVGGSATSRHLDGLALDFIPLAMDRVEAYKHILNMLPRGLALDQVIIYENKPHIHVGIEMIRPARREALVHLRQPVGGRSCVNWDTYAGELKR